MMAILPVIYLLFAAQRASPELQSQSVPDLNAGGLSAPYRTVEFDQLDTDHSVPFYSHGYIVEFQLHTSDLSSPNVVAFDTLTHVYLTIRVWPNGAQELWLNSAGVG